MSSYTIYSSGPPLSVALGTSGSVVTNNGPGTVSYSDSGDPFVAEGTISSGAAVTLYGTQFFTAAEGAQISTLAVAATVALPLAAAWQALDIWPAVTISTTYAAWLTYVDTELASQLASGAVVKTDRGASSDATRHIFSYQGGNGPAHFVLVGGTHGHETIGQHGAFRWFEQFVKAPEMAALRQRLKITYVPTMNPAGYRTSRTTANGVDPNRNYEFFWREFVTADVSAFPSTSSRYKGASAASEPEVVIGKALLALPKVVGLIDCHDLGGADTNQISYFNVSGWVTGDRSLMNDAVQIWDSAYNTADVVHADLSLGYDGPPQFNNYANAYLRYTKGRSNAAVLGMEASGTLGGSTQQGSSTREAMRLYCGLITTWLLRWLERGARASQSAMAYRAIRNVEATGTGVGSGGTSLSSGGNLVWDSISPQASATTQAYVDVVAPCPGHFTVYYDGSFESQGAAGQASASIQSANAGDTLVSQASASGCTVQVPVTAGDRAPFAGSFTQSVTAVLPTTVYRFALQVGKVTVISPSPTVKRAHMQIIFTPATDEQPVARCNPGVT